LDNTIDSWIASQQTPSLYGFMLSITNIGDVLGTIIIFVVFGLFLFRKNKKFFYIFATASTSGIVLTEIIKHLIQRARPFNLLETGFSFPSAHAMISTVFLLSSIYLIAPLLNNKFSKYTFLLITSIVFPLVAFSRIYLSVHFTSDVVAGITLGSICFLFSWLMYCYKKENVL
jgi:undecaprenyl-diphosphatase